MAPSDSIGGFVGGYLTFIRGLRFLIDHPRLIPIALVPFGLTVLLFACATVAGYVYADDLHAWLFPDWDHWFWKILGYVIVTLLMVCMWIFGLVTFGSIVASPFNDYLSQQVEAKMLHGQEPVPGGFARLMRDLAHTVKHETVRLAIYIVIFLVFMPLLLIPFVGGVLFMVIMGYVNMRYLAWNALDYCMARRLWGFRAKMAFLKRHRSRTLGYGAASLTFLAIPFTLLFVLPILAVGGSVLFCRILLEEGEAKGPVSP
ncbi:MAG: EI24 domain-containing protein [Planctomycetota bacterium]